MLTAAVVALVAGVKNVSIEQPVPCSNRGTSPMPSLAFGQRIVLQDEQNILGAIPKLNFCSFPLSPFVP